MRSAVWLAAVALLVGGCMGSPATEPEPVVAPWQQTIAEAAAGTFYHFENAKKVRANESLPIDALLISAKGGYVGIGTTTFEPSIGSTKSGAVFMTSLKRDTVDRGTHIIRGTDRGSTWKDVGPFLGPTQYTLVPNSNDPFLYVDPWTSRIINFDMCATLSGFCMSVSDDDGQTWRLVGVAHAESTALDHQSVAAAPPTPGVVTVGYANVLTFCVNRGTTITGSWCSTSRDGGINWTPLAPGFPANTVQCSGLSGHVKGSKDGRFYRGNPACGDQASSVPAVYRSDDGGIAWSQHIITGAKPVLNGAHDVAVDVDDAGNVYAFWIGQDGLPFFAVSKDRAQTWSKPIMAAPPGVTAAGFPAIAAGAAGRVAFAYIGSTVDDGYKGATNDATWNGYIGVVTDAFAERPILTTVTANSASEDPLAKGACGDRRCGGFGDFIGITIDPEGRPWAAMSNNEHGNAGIVATLQTGPALRGALQPLPAINLTGPASIRT